MNKTIENSFYSLIAFVYLLISMCFANRFSPQKPVDDDRVRD